MARQRRGESRGDAVRCSGRRAGRADRVSDRWDAIVVGAGPAGAATALLLSRGGARGLLLDRARLPRHKRCSESLGPATSAIRGPRRVAFTAHVAHVAGVDGVGELHVGDTGYVGLGPVGEGVTTVALVVPLRSVRAGGTDYRAGLFAQLERFPGLAGRFDPRQLVRAVLATGPFAQWAERPCVAGALLVGGAADFFG